MSLNIQRNDQVEVISGADRGKRGRVLRVFPDESRILVEHVRVVKKNVRPNPQKNIKGGVAEQEAPVHVSNVLLVCPSCGPTRVGHKSEGGAKVRVCRKCGTELTASRKSKRK
jgi:large subunit ribosomal protein L24